MSSASQEFVNARVFLIEQTVTGMQGSMDELRKDVEALKLQLLTRDADLQNAERRFEQLARKMESLEQDKASDAATDGNGERTGGKDGVLRNPALRNLIPYTGDHRKYSKFRSKLKGILVCEDDIYRKALKLM